MADLPSIHPKTRAAWRSWLAKHHATSTGVWLAFFKQSTGKRKLSYSDAVEEALCFGWIDSVLHPVDDERYEQMFSPRKPTSEWSRLNKTRVEALVASGLMTPAGLAKIEAAKQNGAWTKIDHVESLEIPPELEAAFTRRPSDRKLFEAASRSKKKMVLHRIGSAKRPETRAARVQVVLGWLRDGFPRLAPTPPRKK